MATDFTDVTDFEGGQELRDASETAKAHLEQRLFEAVDSGNLETVERILNYLQTETPNPVKTFVENKGGIDGFQQDGSTLSEIAANNGAASCLKILLSAGCEANGFPNAHSTPLIAAARSGSVECAKLLIEAGADINRAGADEETAYIAAVRGNDSKFVDYLEGTGLLNFAKNEQAKKAQAIVNADGKLYGNGSIIAALSTELPKVGTCSYTTVLDICTQDHAREYKDAYAAAILQAAQNGDLQTLNQLLAGYTNSNLYPVKNILEADYDRHQMSPLDTALAAAISSGHHQLIEPLLNAGARLDGPDRYANAPRETPLMAAMVANKLEAFKKLLELGANPKQPSIVNDTELLPKRRSNEETPLDYASQKGLPEMLSILIEEGAHKANSPEDQTVLGPGNYALTRAARNGHKECVDVLIRGGVSPDADITIHDGTMRPLLEAIHAGHTPVVEVLLNHGANPNEPLGSRVNTSTPLMVATESRNPEIVKALLQAKRFQPDENSQLRRTLDTLRANGCGVPEHEITKADETLALSNLEIILDLLNEAYTQKMESEKEFLKDLANGKEPQDPPALSLKDLQVAVRKTEPRDPIDTIKDLASRSMQMHRNNSWRYGIRESVEAMVDLPNLRLHNLEGPFNEIAQALLEDYQEETIQINDLQGTLFAVAEAIKDLAKSVKHDSPISTEEKDKANRDICSGYLSTFAQAKNLEYAIHACSDMLYKFPIFCWDLIFKHLQSIKQEIRDCNAEESPAVLEASLCLADIFYGKVREGGDLVWKFYKNNTPDTYTLRGEVPVAEGEERALKKYNYEKIPVDFPTYAFPQLRVGVVGPLANRSTPNTNWATRELYKSARSEPEGHRAIIVMPADDTPGEPNKPIVLSKEFDPNGWEELRKTGSVRYLRVEAIQRALLYQ